MSETQPPERTAPAAGGTTAWARVEALLNARLAAVEEEIRHYPAPIPACDAQFNYLLEQRAGIPREIARLRDCMQGAASTAQQRHALDAFVADCPFIDAAALSRDPVAG